MEFEEVNDFIKAGKAKDSNAQPSNTFLNNTSSFEHNSPSNLYDSLPSSQPQPTVATKKPTLVDFVNRLKRQSSRTKFEKKYKKLSSELDDYVASDEEDSASDDASIRAIDPAREYTRNSEYENAAHNILYLSDEDNSDSRVEDLNVGSSKRRGKRPLRRVYINEDANQISDLTDSSNDPSIPIDEAIRLIYKKNKQIQESISEELKRIEQSEKEIIKYTKDLKLMETRMESMVYTTNLSIKENVPEMKSQQSRIFENTIIVKRNKKSNNIQKAKFDKYRKAISPETRLSELENKIKAAWRRDEIWSGIRDWGLFSLIVFIFIITFIIAAWWQ